MVELGRVGVWSGGLRGRDATAVADAAAELEDLGFGALWYPGGLDRAFSIADALLGATHTVAVATGIVNVWVDSAEHAASEHARLTSVHPDRFLLGIGISHAPMVERLHPGTYRAPLATMATYLDGLDAACPPVPATERVVAALSERMLALARDRSWGSHTYLVTPEQTSMHRAALGPAALLAPEQGVLLETDPARARASARAALAMYFELPNYVNSWKRAGFTDGDIEHGGSDRLVDALVAHGDPGTVARRITAHLDAGADHVCVQVLGAVPGDVPMDALRALSEALEL